MGEFFNQDLKRTDSIAAAAQDFDNDVDMASMMAPEYGASGGGPPINGFNIGGGGGGGYNPIVQQAIGVADGIAFGVGMSWGSGGFKVKLNFGYDKQMGDFTGSYGLGVTYHSNYYNTGESGVQFRNSFMVNYDDGKNFGASVGTNFWNGMGDMKEFDQRTGMLNLRLKSVDVQYENDGTPFQYLGLGDGGDSYKTAAAKVGYGGQGGTSLNMNLFTGLRDENSFFLEDNVLEGGTMGIPQGEGQFGENYTHGFVHEQGEKYRYGGLTLNHGGMSAGVNSEWIRHAFQNQLAHDFIQDQRQFPMLSGDWKPVFNFSNMGENKFTIWD